MSLPVLVVRRLGDLPAGVLRWGGMAIGLSIFGYVSLKHGNKGGWAAVVFAPLCALVAYGFWTGFLAMAPPSTARANGQNGTGQVVRIVT